MLYLVLLSGPFSCSALYSTVVIFVFHNSFQIKFSFDLFFLFFSFFFFGPPSNTSFKLLRVLGLSSLLSSLSSQS